jgi:hypothetical protein
MMNEVLNTIQIHNTNLVSTQARASVESTGAGGKYAVQR